MITLLMAAAVAAQPVPHATTHGQMAPMSTNQHEAKKDKCCCDDMAKGEHASPKADQRQRGS